MPSTTEMLKKMRMNALKNAQLATEDDETEGQTSAIVGTADYSANMEAQMKKSNDNVDNSIYRNPSHTSLLRETMRGKSKNDFRVNYMDVDNIDLLVSRYEKEFTRASKVMEQKQKSEFQRRWIPWRRSKIPDDDRAYQQWLAREKRVEEVLEIHWMDRIIDRPFATFMYAMRACTIIGGVYGCARSVYLLRSMDKIFAKLHGVSSVDVILHECCLNIVRGLFVAAVGCVGLTSGKLLTQLATTLTSSTPVYPERSWSTFAMCGFYTGLSVTPLFLYFARHAITRRGVKAITAACVLTGTFVGTSCGYCFYRPFALKRAHDPYDMHWRPWYEREMWKGAESKFRGRYV